MTNGYPRTRTRVQKWGWTILLAVSFMLVLNGVGWFFTGPGTSLSNIEQDTGVPLAEFKESYPTVADGVEENARQVAIWFMAFGILALVVALEGFRRGSRWAWNATWTLVAAPAAIALNVLAGGGGIFGFAVLGVAAVALVGQLLAREELSTQASAAGRRADV